MRAKRFLMVSALVLGTVFAGGPVHAQDPSAPPRPGRHYSTRSQGKGVEARIQKLHDSLQITDAQAGAWKAVADVMRDNDTAMRALMRDRRIKAGSMSAVEMVDSYRETADLRADHLKKFAAAFGSLYSGMSPEQKKNADTLMRDDKRMIGQWAR